MRSSPSIVHRSPYRKPGPEQRPSPRNTRAPRSVAYAAPCRPGAASRRTTRGDRRPAAVVRASARRASRDVLDDDARSALARTMAERVVDAAAHRGRSSIVSSAPEVVAWARDARARRRRRSRIARRARPTPGARWARDAGPRPGRRRARRPAVRDDRSTTSPATAPRRIAVLVPDHRDDGTPVLALPSTSPFAFAYGPGSSARHVRRSRARRARACASCATTRSASTSTSRPTSRSRRRLDVARDRDVTRRPRRARPRARDRRPPRRHRVRLRRDARQVGRRRAPRCTLRLHRRLEGHAGTPTPTSRSCSPYAKRSSGPRPRCSARRRRVPRLRRRRARPRPRRRARRSAPSSARTRPDVVLGHDPWQPYRRIHPDHRQRACSRSKASSRHAIRTSSPSRASRRIARDAVAVRSRSASTMSSASTAGRPQGRRAARAPQPVALDDGHRRPAPRSSRPRSSARSHDERASGGICAPASAPPRRSPASTSSSRASPVGTTSGHEGTRVHPGPFYDRRGSAQRFLAVRFRTVRFVARLAGAFLAALRGLPCASRWPSTALLGGLALHGLALGGRLRRLLRGLAPHRLLRRCLALGGLLLGRPCASRAPCAWPEPSSLPCASREPCALPCAWPEPSSPPYAWRAPSAPSLPS